MWYPSLRKKNAALASLRWDYQTCSNTRSATEERLRHELKSPGPVIQPLPQSAHTAAQWLFFLYMPPLFR